MAGEGGGNEGEGSSLGREVDGVLEREGGAEPGCKEVVGRGVRGGGGFYVGETVVGGGSEGGFAKAALIVGNLVGFWGMGSEQGCEGGVETAVGHKVVEKDCCAGGRRGERGSMDCVQKGSIGGFG